MCRVQSGKRTVGQKAELQHLCTLEALQDVTRILAEHYFKVRHGDRRGVVIEPGETLVKTEVVKM